MSRARPDGMPASASEALARRWCSLSASTEVSTPSGRMPDSSHSDETPAPVPSSMTDLAPRAAASSRRAAPVAGSTAADAHLAGPLARCDQRRLLRLPPGDPLRDDRTLQRACALARPA